MYNSNICIFTMHRANKERIIYKDRRLYRSRNPLHSLHSALGPARLFHLGRVALRPLAQELADNLAAGELGHGVDKGHAAGDALVLGDAGGDPVLNVAGLDLALGDVLDLDVGAGELFVVAGMLVSFAIFRCLAG